MDKFQSTQLVNSSLLRCTYHVTYSQADLTKFPTRKGFGECIKKHFNSGSRKVKVQHWACTKEKLQNEGIHYHVILKLAGPKRWKSVKENISLNEGIVVNFSDNHENYYSAYSYLCKDNDSVHHNKHPPLPQFRWSCIIPDKIKAEGQTDLAAFVLSRSSKSLNGLIENTWKMNNAKTSIEREKTIRIQILRKCQSESCVDDCEMEWYECARQGIQLNSINPFVFPEAMRDSLWMEEASSAMYW